jgi:hypothetical protein
MIASNRIAIHPLSLSIKYSGNPDFAACLGIAVPENRIAVLLGPKQNSGSAGAPPL